MKKVRHYFGKNKVNHTLGRFNSQWVVPRMMRLYFQRKYELLNLDAATKFNINSAYGSMAQKRPYGDSFQTGIKPNLPEPVKALPDLALQFLIQRQQLKAMFRSGSMPDPHRMARTKVSAAALSEAITATHRILSTYKLQQASEYGKFANLDGLDDQWKHYCRAFWFYELGECYPQIAMTLWGIASHLIEKLPRDMQLRWQTDPRVQEMLANAEVAIENGTAGKLVPPPPEKVAVIVGTGRGLTIPSTWFPEEDILTFGQFYWAPAGLYDLNWASDRLIKEKIDAFFHFLAEPVDVEVSITDLSKVLLDPLPADIDVTLTYPGTLNKFPTEPVPDGNFVVAMGDHRKQLEELYNVPWHLQGGTPVLQMESPLATFKHPDKVQAFLKDWSENILKEPEVEFKPIGGMREGVPFDTNDPDFTITSMEIDEKTGMAIGHVVDHKGLIAGTPGGEVSLKDMYPVSAGSEGTQDTTLRFGYGDNDVIPVGQPIICHVDLLGADGTPVKEDNEYYQKIRRMVAAPKVAPETDPLSFGTAPYTPDPVSVINVVDKDGNPVEAEVKPRDKE